VFYHFVEVGNTSIEDSDTESTSSSTSDSSNSDFETFLTTCTELECDMAYTEQPRLEEQIPQCLQLNHNDHESLHVHPLSLPLPITSQEDLTGQRFEEEQEFNDFCLDDLNLSSLSPVPPPYSPLPITAQEESEYVESRFGFKLVGDNVDKDVKPRHMRINHQTKSLHYFNVLAVQDRIPTFHLSEERMSTPSLEVNDFILTNDDYTALKNYFAILISRILCNHMDFFKKVFGKHINHHIPHKYSAEMCRPTNIVSCKN